MSKMIGIIIMFCQYYLYHESGVMTRKIFMRIDKKYLFFLVSY